MDKKKAIKDIQEALGAKRKQRSDAQKEWVEKWGLEAIAEATGLNLRTVSNIVNGHGNPGKASLLSVARYLGVDRD